MAAAIAEGLRCDAGQLSLWPELAHRLGHGVDELLAEAVAGLSIDLPEGRSAAEMAGYKAIGQPPRLPLNRSWKTHSNSQVRLATLWAK